MSYPFVPISTTSGTCNSVQGTVCLEPQNKDVESLTRLRSKRRSQKQDGPNPLYSVLSKMGGWSVCVLAFKALGLESYFSVGVYIQTRFPLDLFLFIILHVA